MNFFNTFVRETGPRNQKERAEARIEALKEEQGSKVAVEEEILRIKQLQKNYQTDIEKPEKKLAALDKKVKAREKEKEKLNRLRASLAEKES